MLHKKSIVQVTIVMLYSLLSLEAKIPSREFRKLPCYSDTNFTKGPSYEEQQVKMDPRAKKTDCAENCWLQYGFGPDNLACQTECPGPNIEDLTFNPIAQELDSE